MTTLEYIEAQYIVGQDVFEKIFTLPAAKIRELVKDLSANNKTVQNYRFSFESAQVDKTITEDKPNNIKISWHASFQINWQGIYFRPEHSAFYTEPIITFDKFTVIPEKYYE